MITPKQADELRALMLAEVEAQVELSWVGGGDPADRPLVEATAALATAKVVRYLQGLIELPQSQRERY